MSEESKLALNPEAEIASAMEELKADDAADPWSLADKAGKQLDTPMDNKTIKNAILKRLPEVRRIQLIKVDDLGKMQIVVVCQLLNETAIVVEDDANIFMRHKDLMNIVDKMWNEIVDRKKLRKTNKLPDDFFRTEKALALSQYRK